MSLYSPFDDAQDQAEYSVMRQLDKIRNCDGCGQEDGHLYCKICNKSICLKCVSRHEHIKSICRKCKSPIRHLADERWVNEGSIWCYGETHKP